MRSRVPSDSAAETMVVRFLGPGPFMICGDPAVIAKSLTLVKDVAMRVPKAVGDWAMGMNSSRQAEVFELVTGEEGVDPMSYSEHRDLVFPPHIVPERFKTEGGEE